MDTIKSKLGYQPTWQQWKPGFFDDAVHLALFVGVPVVVGFLIGLLTAKDVKGWYKTLRKPKFNPPSSVFPVVWTVLYVMMGSAAWLVWSNGGWKQHKFALSAYTVQLFLNFLWNPTFFFLRKLDWALVDITLLLGALATTIATFHHVDDRAAMLLVPYFLWVSFATYLNFSFCELNPKASRHIVDAFTIKKRVQRRVAELKAEMID
ncbi:hypothetical protein WJX73_004161 [Symbiochloris irregularis]|uniref:Uncharacterized protein n=1 Tax=Symbiochloris irregularis TaxID=706552 RepID=A0AAW1P8A0_9CHLO